MNIKKFKDNVDKTILKRGYDYYNEGNIIETYSQRDNQYIFLVKGSDDYEVVVKKDEDGEILYSHCDCPFDFGPVCKHQAAVYFKLFEIFNFKENNGNAEKETKKQPELKEVLNSLSNEDLIDIILGLTQNDATLKNSLIVKYSKGDGTRELEMCKKLLNSIVIKYRGRAGFISYRETYRFVSEMEELFEKVRGTDDTLLAIDIAFLVLNEAMKSFQYADDSNGDIGSFVAETIELIEETVFEVDDTDLNLREVIFDKLLEESEKKIFDGWEDYKIGLLHICAEFADVEALRHKLRVKIENMVNKESDDRYMEYRNEAMLQLLLQIIEEYGTEKEAEQFINDNINYSSFRELLLSKYMIKKNYSKVIELALKGEKQDSQFAGLLSKWKKIRYAAYKELSLKEEQKKLARELLLRGDFDYYQELKILVVEDEKDEFYNGLKQELKTHKGPHGRSMHLKLIVEENDLDEILDYVKENPRDIEKYADMLVKKFSNEVNEIYKKYIQSAASSSSDRKKYKEVCNILKRYKKIAGKKNQEELIHELSALYKKRTAFVDELSKI
ncbi:SWIM zinc finger family protein [Psychrobacillus vulpis]|uniref:SWIM-type domain-containing protein n=1 Tax=Psychrobacillus vulpis TaxID=2325572 RepID=A0A544TUX6_9BACI|nr:hypothetical protein [Psychrobacillus vulpis]TQR21254.1 hypothetical protein FG384_03340 [Psychrobacillus vulpis]